MSNSPRSAAPTPRPSGLVRWGLPALVFALAFAAFWPALQQGFVTYDDDVLFLNNPYYRGLGAEQLRWMWTANTIGHYMPLSWVTLGLDYELWGMDGRGYHLTNLLLHAASAVVLYHLILALLRAARGDEEPMESGRELGLRLAAALGALLHAMHPLRVESVAWATERRDVLSGLFLLLCVLAYLRMARSGGWAWMLLALIAYAASLLSKAWGITLPVCLLVLDAWPLRRFGRVSTSRLIGEKLLFAPLAIGLAMRAAEAQREVQATMGFDEHTLLERFAQAGYGVVFYVHKTLWPTDLSPLYLLELDFDPFGAVYVASFVVAVAITVGLFLARRRWPSGLAAWAVFCVTVSPVLGFLQSGTQKVADRYTYLACIPFAVLAAGGLARLLAGRAGEEPARGPRKLVVAGVAVVLAVLGFASTQQTRVWRDTIPLFERIVEVEPHNYFGWNNLSVGYQNVGRVDDAIDAAQHSVEAHPGKGNEDARFNLGLFLRQARRNDEALEAFRGALEVEPAHEKSLAEVSRDLLGRGEVSEAIELYERALEAEPSKGAFYEALVGLYSRAGRTADLPQLWERAAGRAPSWAPGRHQHGVSLMRQGRLQEAEVHLLAAQRLDTHNPDFVVDAAEMLWRTNRTPNAVAALQQVIAKYPTHARANALMQRIQTGGL